MNRLLVVFTPLQVMFATALLDERSTCISIVDDTGGKLAWAVPMLEDRADCVTYHTGFEAGSRPTQRVIAQRRAVLSLKAIIGASAFDEVVVGLDSRAEAQYALSLRTRNGIGGYLEDGVGLYAHPLLPSAGLLKTVVGRVAYGRWYVSTARPGQHPDVERAYASRPDSLAGDERFRDVQRIPIGRDIPNLMSWMSGVLDHFSLDPIGSDGIIILSDKGGSNLLCEQVLGSATCSVFRKVHPRVGDGALTHIPGVIDLPAELPIEALIGLSTGRIRVVSELPSSALYLSLLFGASVRPILIWKGNRDAPDISFLEDAGVEVWPKMSLVEGWDSPS